LTFYFEKLNKNSK